MEKIVLFDGTSTDMWRVMVIDKFFRPDGTSYKLGRIIDEPIEWEVKDGAMTVTRGNIISTVSYGDAHIHVEWMEPDMPEAQYQEKGNSGVYIHARYELQVLDSYGIKEDALRMDDCGAIYEISAPLVNACKPALEWQTYDIYFRAPRFNEDGSVKENARVTVVQNGIMIQNNLELPHTTPGGMDRVQVAEGQLVLQDHGNPVSFRNIYIEKY